MITRQQRFHQKVIGCALGILPVCWFGLLLAPCMKGNLFSILEKVSAALRRPFVLELVPNTGKTLGVVLLIYAVAVLWILSDNRNYRHDGEYGTARFGSPKALRSELRSKVTDNNLILTKQVQLGTDNVYDHGRNLNIMITGGPGSWKTRSHTMPNLMQMTGSYVVLDPAGEVLANIGPLLQKNGYHIQVLNLKNPEQSDPFNPFPYIHSSKEVMDLAEIVWKATTDKDAHKGEQIWEDMGKNLFIALAEFLYEVAPPHEQNLPMICDLVNEITIDEANPTAPCPLDIYFAQVQERDQESFAAQKYWEFKSAAGKTMKSIKTTLSAHIGRMQLPAIRKLMEVDAMQLDRVGMEKTAIFCVTPVADTTLNFVVSMLYQVLFNQLYALGDEMAERGGSNRLPVPVHFLMDEFANVTIPNDFQNRLGTMRKYGIGCSIMLQAVDQLKTLFEKGWESIVGLCDTFLYLGSNEQSTHKFVSEAMDTETVDVKTYSQSRGKTGGSSEQNQRIGRKLMLPGEVRKLPRRKAILLVSGEDPVLDSKYDVKMHYRYKETAFVTKKPYRHDNLSECVCQMQPVRMTAEEERRAKEPEPVAFRWAFSEDAELEEPTGSAKQTVQHGKRGNIK